MPLGMENTFYKDNKDIIIKNNAIGYELEENQFKEFHYYNHAVVGAGGLHTNLEDLVRWSNNLKTGKVGGAAFIKNMITPGTLNNGDPIRFAGGLYSQNHYDIEGLPRVSHSGNWAGFQSLYYKFLKQDFAVIILSNNADTFVWGLLDQLTPLFLEKEITQAQLAMNTNNNTEIKPLSLSKREKEKFCGKFYNTLNGYLRQIELEGDKLMYKRPQANPIPLVAISPNELIYAHTSQVKFTFNVNTYDSMTVTINDSDPMSYQKYNEHIYKQSELKQFENSYYNEDIDEVFQIAVLENELQVLVKGEEIIRMKPIAIDIFTSAHSGYIVFERNQNSKITGFTRYDDILYNLKHEVIESNRK